MNPPVKLRLENVAKRFGNAGVAQTTAVQDFTLDVPAGPCRRPNSTFPRTVCHGNNA